MQSGRDICIRCAYSGYCSSLMLETVLLLNNIYNLNSYTALNLAISGLSLF